MRLITYDVEIAEEVDSHPEKWDGARRGECGVSSVVLFDTYTDRYHLYDEHTIVECMRHLNSADLLIGFNSINFDKPCLEGYTKTKLNPQDYDIFAEVKKALEQAHRPLVKGEYGLDALCTRTLGMGKSGTGEAAPKLYKQERYAELFDYNLHDVFLTRKLFNHIHDVGFVIDVDKNQLFLRRPYKHVSA